MKKKLTVLMLVLVMIVASLGTLAAFTGCTDTESEFKVGAIYINSKSDTSGYTYAHHNGIVKAMEQLGLDVAQLKIVDNVPEDYTKVTNAIDTLAVR